MPLPLAPAVIVSQDVALLAAVQPQPVPAVTVTVPVVAVEEVRFDEVGEIDTVHWTPAWVMVKVCPAIVIVPVRDVVPGFAATL